MTGAPGPGGQGARPGASALTGAWLLGLFALLFVQATSAAPLRAMLVHLAPIPYGVAFLLSFMGWGAPLALRLQPRAERIDQLLLASALGAGLTALFIFVLGLAGQVNPALHAVWVLLGLLSLGVHVARRPRWRAPFGRPSADSRLNLLAGLVFAVFFLQLLPLLVAPVSSKDALEYHLMVPKLILAEGQIGLIPNLMESNYPALASYLYVLVKSLGGDPACKVLHCLAGVGVLLAMARLVARVAPTATRSLAPAFFASLPVASYVMALAWNDHFYVFFLVLACGYLVSHHLEPEVKGFPTSLFVAGLLVGLAAWTKYTVVLFLFGLTPLFLLAMLRWRWRLRDLLVFAAPVGVLSLLVFVKNAVLTGNPFLPFLSGVFPSSQWSEASAAYFELALRHWEIPTWDWTTYLTWPVHLFLKPRLIDIHPGVLPLALAPLACLPWRGGQEASDVRSARAVTFLQALLGFHLLAWLCVKTETRSLLTFFAILLVLGAISFERRVWSQRRHRRVALLAVSLVLLANLSLCVFNSWHLHSPLAWFAGQETRDKYLKGEVRSYAACSWLNRRGEVGRVLLVGLKRPYYVAKPVAFSAFADTPIAQVVTRGTDSSEELLAKLRREGFTHMVLDEEIYEADIAAGLYSWPPEQRDVFQAMVRGCQQVKRYGPQRIFVLGQ